MGKYIEKVQLVLGVLCLSVFFIAILIQVFSRYLGIPVIWTEEVANFSFIWAVFMGASIMVRSKSHFRFNLMSQKLKGKPKVILEMFINGLLLAFNLFISYYGILVVRTFWNYRWVTFPNIKMGYTWMILPIMGITMSIYIIEHIIENIQQLRGIKPITEETTVEDLIEEIIEEEGV
ncbi:TRAP-type C4-dicarboxylate transport system, small permease component [Natronincola peptidivorans]|uniref:TRAP-type C4-dicarboxylate transport system, small permease component n=1 Tax=Natronincola peptidivorans TaxID=426128 RepID=A0A1I0G8Y9_9FIRM|nr:TRAP transporter small permease [Natronincola peptidivorans]SET66381.1 TRAP-type C4-dicarboxylate transport system, small permease component [Natronincola peptidivorans]